MKPEDYVTRKLKPPKHFFDWCESQIPVYEWKNKQKQIISSTRRSSIIVSKRLMKNSCLSLPSKFYSFAIVLVTTKRIEIQSYGYWLVIKQGKEFLERRLTNFEIFENGRHIKITQYFNQFIFGLSNIYGIMGGPYCQTHFFDNNWEKRIQTVSELKYISFGENQIKRCQLSHVYRFRREIEFLQKINAKIISHEVLNNINVDMRTINRKWLKKNKHLLRDSNVSFKEFELNRRILNKGGTVVPGIHKYINYHDIKRVPKRIGITKFQNWVLKYKIDLKTYFDYLDLMKELNIPLEGTNVLLPSNLCNAHDNAVELLNRRKRDVELKEFEERFKELKHLEEVIDDYSFLIPKSANDLILEGKMLHHCVGGAMYINNHAKGKTTIVFIREKNQKEKPLYTLEFNRNTVVQCRGKHNKIAPDEVMNAVEKWANHARQKLENRGNIMLEDA